MKRVINRILCTAMATCFICTGTVYTKAAKTAAVEYSNYDIIKEIAYAYDRQGKQIPYDQLNARRSIYSSPEDATAQRTIFLDCSSFANSCYREAFGVNVMPYEIGESGTSPSTVNYDAYARDNQTADDVVGYWEPADYTTDEERQEVVDWIYENLQIGDVLTYRHNKNGSMKGHVYMYIGNSAFIHCAGAGSYTANSSNPALSYDNGADEIESNGTIGTLEADIIFKDTTHTRYIFKATESDTVTSFSIIRPMVRGLSPTEETLNRMKIAGLSMEKICSVCENNSVDTGDILTYTVTLENTNKSALSGVTIADTIPEGTVFISGDDGVITDGMSVSWQGDVPAKTTKNVSYSVKITESIPGTLITSDSTYVSGVKLGNITHSVSGYSKTQRALIADTAIGYANAAEPFDDGFALAKAAYKSTFGIDITDCENVGDALDELIYKEGRTKYTTTELSKIIAPNLYGGLDIRYGWLYLPSENDKTRLPKEEHLAVGDIILADWSGGSNVYIYAGNHTLVTVENGVSKALTIDDDIYTRGKNIIISLLGYNRYAILRPSMASSVPELDVSSIAITTPPSKTEYLSGESFDTQGMVVTATMSDRTEREISAYTVSPSILMYGTNSVTVSFGGKTASADITVASNKLITSVSDALLLDVDKTVTVEGLVAGIASEGQNNDTEVLLKDMNSDAIIALRNIPYGIYPDFGYKKGDRIVFVATVKKDTSESTSYTNKKYLEFSSENGTIDTTIISQGNKLNYKFDTVTELGSWADMQSHMGRKKITPYTYLRITSDSFFNYYSGTYDTYYRLHKNAEATAVADIKPDGERSISLLNNAMTANLGSEWTSLFFDELVTGQPGTPIDTDFYALYIGGNSLYFQLVVLEESWVQSGRICADELDLGVPAVVKTAESDGFDYDGRAKITVYDKESGLSVRTIYAEDEKVALSLNRLPAGSYDITVEKNGYLAYRLENVAVSADSETKLKNISLMAGDIKDDYADFCGDGKVDLGDFVRILRGFSYSDTDEYRKYEAVVDLNGDGVITVKDLDIIKQNFGKSSEDYNK